jgi:hypothetical protein
MAQQPQPQQEKPRDGAAPLNPALKSERDPDYGPDYQGTDFMETVSVKKEEGRAWPMIWLVSFIVCVLVTVLIFVL